MQRDGSPCSASLEPCGFKLLPWCSVQGTEMGSSTRGLGLGWAPWRHTGSRERMGSDHRALLAPESKELRIFQVQQPSLPLKKTWQSFQRCSSGQP